MKIKRQDTSIPVFSYVMDIFLFSHPLQLLITQHSLVQFFLHPVNEIGAAFGHAVVVQVLAHAADAVAAHFSLRAVGVEDTHLRIRLVGRRNKDNAVAADTEVRLTELD